MATAEATRCCWPTSSASPGEDWLERPSDWLDGIRAIAVGMAGNESLRTGLPVKIADLDLGVDLSRCTPAHPSPRRRRRVAAVQRLGIEVDYALQKGTSGR